MAGREVAGKPRFIRINDETWDRAMARASSEGTNISELVRAWLTLYGDNDESMSVTAELARAISVLNSIGRRLEQDGSKTA